MDLSRTVSEINGDFNRKSQNFQPSVYFAPRLKGFALELGTGARGQKKLERWVYRAEKKFDENFSRVDTMHQCDRQTDGRTPGDSKDRAYA